MQRIRPFLWFDADAEEAVNFYLSVFPEGRITGTMARPNGAVLGLHFTLIGQDFIALNGGPHFTFTPAISMFVDCDTQAQVDDLWTKLTAGGGSEQKCGWLKDRFGLSWQIVPKVLGEMLQDKDRARADRVFEAMMGMVKLDIAGLKAAYDRQ